MKSKEIDRIQNAIRHIKTSVDIDSWAMEIAVEAMEAMEKQDLQPTCNQLATDTISRTAAIDVLKGLPTWWADEGGYYGGAQPPMVALLDPEDAVSAIENLPPAQPEPCGDAVSRQYILDALDEYIEEYGEVDKKGNHDLKWCAMGEAKMVVKEAPPAQPEPQWIPVSERLPEDGTEVFVYLFDRPSPFIAWIEDTRWYTEDFEVERENEPIAWMPIPEPYRAERITDE